MLQWRKMPHPSKMVSAPSDPKGRLIAIFVGAVLVPSLALSIVSFHSVPSQAKATRASLVKQAEQTLYLVERDLHVMALSRAQDAAQVVGTDRLLDGRPEVVRGALVEAG